MDDSALIFGRFRVDFARRELSVDRRPVRLGGRALERLCVLASARNALVTKSKLMLQVLPGVVVEKNNVQVQIPALRKVLDPEEADQNCIITIPVRGCRLIGFEPAHLAAGRFEEAIRWAYHALHGQPRVAPSIRTKIVALAHLGRIHEARAAVLG